MPSYEVTVDRTWLYAGPSEDQKVDRLRKGDTLTQQHGTPGDPQGLYIAVVFPGGAPPESGFVLRSAVKEVADAPSPMDKEGFVRACLDAERSMNIQGIPPFVVVADWLIARALIETDLTNPGGVVDGQDGVGPLQVTSQEWTDFLSNGGDLGANEYEPNDRFSPTLQVNGAAYRMHKDGKAISDANAQPGADPNSDGPFLPSYLDQLHCYLANSAEAAVALLKAQSAGQGAKKLGAPDNVLKAEAIAAIAAHPKFKGRVDATATVDDLVHQTEGLLTSSLKSAFDLIKQFAPEQVPPEPAAPRTGAGGQIIDPAPSSSSQESGVVSFARYTGGGSLPSWIETACGKAGVPYNLNWKNGMTTLCNRESSSIPNAVNTTDTNATGPIVADGHRQNCSRGVSQCIPSTFARYHADGTSWQIYDPVANIAAAIRYIMARYKVQIDGSNLSSRVQQADPNRSPRGY